MILCSNPRAQYLSHKAEVYVAISEVLESGWYILGEQVRAFEAEFASYVGVAHGVGVGSGTEALHLALSACGIGRGDEVITVSHTAVATVAAIELAGATPVLVDVESDFFTLDLEALERAATPRTRAIIPVHIYGQPADLAPILDFARGHGLRVIEDCSQAHGATYRGKRVGSFGDLGCFSFYPTKNLGAVGDGGIVVTDDEELADEARSLREYGWRKDRISDVAGLNSRLDELQAAILRVKLKGLDEDNASRAGVAQQYDAGLRGLPLDLPRVRDGATHVYHQYVARSPRRDDLRSFLQDRGVQTLVHYPVPVHLQPAYQGRLAGAATLPETERVVGEILSLPIYPELDEADRDRVTQTVVEFHGG